MPVSIKGYCFGCVILCWYVFGFLVRMPVFLVHLWLCRAHIEAPVSGSMILAGILLQLGGYGLLHVFPFCLSLGLVLLLIWLFGVRCICVCVRDIHVGLHPQKVILYIYATRICSTFLRQAA